jgi:hypothetical protein
MQLDRASVAKGWADLADPLAFMDLDCSDKEAAEVGQLVSAHFATCERLDECGENGWIVFGRLFVGGKAPRANWFGSSLRVIVVVGTEFVHVFGPEVPEVHCHAGPRAKFELLPWDRHAAALPSMARMTADTGVVLDIELMDSTPDPMLTPAEMCVAIVVHGFEYSESLSSIPGDDVSNLVAWKMSVAHLDRTRRLVQSAGEVIEGSLDYFCDRRFGLRRPERTRRSRTASRPPNGW